MNKQELIKGLKDEYQKWQELLVQIGIEHMDQPEVTGQWSIKDIIAHLTFWRRFTVARLIAAKNGDRDAVPPWPENLRSDDEINDWIYQNKNELTVQEILDESNQVFLEFIDAIEVLPEEIVLNISSLPWMEGRPLSASVFFSHFHEEHEPDMRAWLTRINKY